MLLKPESSSFFYFKNSLSYITSSASTILLKTENPNVEFRKCIVGEIISEVSIDNQNGYQQCFLCEEKTYSIVDPSN